MADALGAYRAQNGIAETGSFDPTVVAWIKQAAAQTGADPSALLATSLQESGAQRGRVGDQGTSFGPFQFHVGGALGSHTPQWANTYAAVLNRAQQFSRLGVHGGVGAAAVQRPADQQLYAQGVNSLMARANAILGRTPSGGPTPVSHPQNAPGRQLTYSPGAALNFVNALLGDSSLERLQQLGQQLVSAAPSQAPGGDAGPPPSVAGGLPGKVVGTANPKLIGYPYQGTHRLGNWESDNAIDISLPIGTPIRAVADGVIGNQIGSLGAGGRFAGLRVHLQTAGNELYYAHLSKLLVKAGQHVKAGQIIGYSGQANGVAHLHLGAKSGNPQVYA